tara:strand:- start:116 stop:346 length:231 start_codon:yes stop_codon:yes gene_type:complete
MELTRIEKALWDNDLEKMLANHLEDAKDSLENLKECPQIYGQIEEDWISPIKRCQGKIDGLKQAIKLLKLIKEGVL